MSWKRWIECGLAAVLLLAAVPVRGGDAPAEKVLSFAVPPERNLFAQKERYQALEDFLNARLSFKVRMVIYAGYTEALEAISRKKVQGGVLGSLPAVYAHEVAGLTPLLRFERSQGDSFYRSYIIKGAQVQVTDDPKTWKGMSFAFVHQWTSAGFFYPMAYLRTRGVKDPRKHLSNIQFTGAHDSVVFQVDKGRADIGACKSNVFDEMAAADPGLRKRVKIVNAGGRFPNEAFLLATQVPAPQREELARILAKMPEDPQGAAVLGKMGAVRLIPTTLEDYADVYNVIKDAGYEAGKLNTLTQKDF